MTDEFWFTVRSSAIEPVRSVTLSEAGFSELASLGDWVASVPSLLGPDVLVVSTGIEGWQKIDPAGVAVLGLRADGTLVVGLLTQDDAPYDAGLHLLQYAAVVSRLTPAELAAEHARYLTDRGKPTGVEQAAELLLHQAAIDDAARLRPAMVLISPVVSEPMELTMSWLNEIGLDIRSVQYRAYAVGSEIMIRVSAAEPETSPATPVAPSRPAVADVVDAPATEMSAPQESNKRQQDTRSVVRIVNAGAIDDGAVFFVNPCGINDDLRPLVEHWLDAYEPRRMAIWLNDTKQPLRWEADGETYSPTGLARHILSSATGVDRALQGGRWWVDAEGRTLVDIAENLVAWDETAFRRIVGEFLPEVQAVRLLSVLDYSLAKPSIAEPYWGNGRYPSANITLKWAAATHGGGTLVWTVHARPDLTTFAFNFQAMEQAGVPVSVMSRIAKAMSTLPGVDDLYDDLAQSGYRKRPAIPADLLFSDDRAADVINSCVDDLLAALGVEAPLAEVGATAGDSD